MGQRVMRTFLGESGDAGKPECIVVSPTTSSVHVKLFSKDAYGIGEEWVVARDAERVSFRRPDGSPVIAAQVE